MYIFHKKSKETLKEQGRLRMLSMRVGGPAANRYKTKFAQKVNNQHQPIKLLFCRSNVDQVLDTVTNVPMRRFLALFSVFFLRSFYFCFHGSRFKELTYMYYNPFSINVLFLFLTPVFSKQQICYQPKLQVKVCNVSLATS